MLCCRISSFLLTNHRAREREEKEEVVQEQQQQIMKFYSNFFYWALWTLKIEQDKLQIEPDFLKKVLIEIGNQI